MDWVVTFYKIICSLFGSSELHCEEGWVMTGQSSIIFQYTKVVIHPMAQRCEHKQDLAHLLIATESLILLWILYQE